MSEITSSPVHAQEFVKDVEGSDDEEIVLLGEKRAANVPSNEEIGDDEDEEDYDDDDTDDDEDEDEGEVENVSAGTNNINHQYTGHEGEEIEDEESDEYEVEDDEEERQIPGDEDDDEEEEGTEPQGDLTALLLGDPNVPQQGVNEDEDEEYDEVEGPTVNSKKRTITEAVEDGDETVSKKIKA
ncbi:hypothetical protein AX17_000187 [Amanita inopinata Kibby_2008]|nr:hypothetical protein AX17_000187 [Amanita inopinata Kibby_2008]